MISTIGTCCLCEVPITHNFNTSEPQGVGKKPPSRQQPRIDIVRTSMLSPQAAGGQDENTYEIPAGGPVIDTTNPDAAIDQQTLPEGAFKMPLTTTESYDNRTLSICEVAQRTANNYHTMTGQQANPSLTHTLNSIANATEQAPDYSRLIVTLLNQGGLEQFSQQVIKQDGVTINKSGENIVDDQNAFAIFPNGLVAHHKCLWDSAESQVKRPVGAATKKNPYSQPNSQTKPGWFAPAWQPSGVWGAGETAFKIPFYIIPHSLRALFSSCSGSTRKKSQLQIHSQFSVNPAFTQEHTQGHNPLNGYATVAEDYVPTQNPLHNTYAAPREYEYDDITGGGTYGELPPLDQQAGDYLDVNDGADSDEGSVHSGNYGFINERNA